MANETVARAAFWAKLRELDAVFGENHVIIDCQAADIDLALDALFEELNEHNRG